MKPLILFYTMNGNNKNLAAVISKRLNCPSEQIIEKKKRTMFTLMAEMLFKKLPGIEGVKKNLKDYDHLILIAPVWIGMPATPMNSLFKKYKDQIRDYSFISLCGGSLGPNNKLCNYLQNKLNKKPKACAELYVNDIAGVNEKGKPCKIMKIKASADEIEKKYNEKINKFLAEIK